MARRALSHSVAPVLVVAIFFILLHHCIRRSFRTELRRERVTTCIPASYNIARILHQLAACNSVPAFAARGWGTTRHAGILISTNFHHIIAHQHRPAIKTWFFTASAHHCWHCQRPGNRAALLGGQRASCSPAMVFAWRLAPHRKSSWVTSERTPRARAAGLRHMGEYNEGHIADLVQPRAADNGKDL